MQVQSCRTGQMDIQTSRTGQMEVQSSTNGQWKFNQAEMVNVSSIKHNWSM